MNLYSALGAVVAYFIVCFIAGRFLPVFHIATIIAAAVGGFVGTIIGGALFHNDDK